MSINGDAERTVRNMLRVGGRAGIVLLKIKRITNLL